MCMRLYATEIPREEMNNIHHVGDLRVVFIFYCSRKGTRQRKEVKESEFLFCTKFANILEETY